MFSLFFIFVLNYRNTVKKNIFKILAKINKAVLPSYTKQRLDLAKATKLQMAIFGWRIFITKNALD